MDRSYKIVALFSVVAMLIACGGSKSLSKKGEKLEEAGLYQESANLHYQALGISVKYAGSQRSCRNVDSEKYTQRNLDAAENSAKRIGL